MKAVIIAEGRGDLAVLSNILYGTLGFNISDLDFRRPSYNYDQTDLHNMDPAQFGGWVNVKNECAECIEDLNIFLELNEDAILIVQIDTAERFMQGYDVLEPLKNKSDDYCENVVYNISSKINEWLDGNFTDRRILAICVEEIEAWLLTIYLGNETSQFNNPKERLLKELNKKLSKRDISKLKNLDEFNKYLWLSKDFTKEKELRKYSEFNYSLTRCAF